MRTFSSSVHIAAPSAERFLRPIPTGRNTAPFAANEFTESRKDVYKRQTEECKDFWEAILNYCPEIKKPNVKVERYRDSNGGSLFFRPIALYPLDVYKRQIQRIILGQ